MLTSPNDNKCLFVQAGVQVQDGLMLLIRLMCSAVAVDVAVAVAGGDDIFHDEGEQVQAATEVAKHNHAELFNITAACETLALKEEGWNSMRSYSADRRES